MNAAEFSELFDEAFKDWSEEDREDARRVIRQDWMPGPGADRGDIVMGDHHERRRHWAEFLKKLVHGPAYGINERVRESIRLERENEDHPVSV